MQVSASLGQVSTTIQIARVTPVVSPWGGQESSFGWDLTSTDRHPITGVRHFFAIIPSPEPALSVASGACACTWLRPCTGCPSAFALTGAKAGERRVLLDPLHSCPVLTVHGQG